MCDHIRQEYDASPCLGCERESALVHELGELKRQIPLIEELEHAEKQLAYMWDRYDLCLEERDTFKSLAASFEGIHEKGSKDFDALKKEHKTTLTQLVTLHKELLRMCQCSSGWTCYTCDAMQKAAK